MFEGECDFLKGKKFWGESKEYTFRENADHFQKRQPLQREKQPAAGFDTTIILYTNLVLLICVEILTCDLAFYVFYDVLVKKNF